MKKFESLHKAFKWAFNDKESMLQLKYDFKLNDEFENIRDVTGLIDEETLEDYLLKETYILPYEDGYVFYDNNDLEDDDIMLELAGRFGEDEEKDI